MSGKLAISSCNNFPVGSSLISFCCKATSGDTSKAVYKSSGFLTPCENASAASAAPINVPSKGICFAIVLAPFFAIVLALIGFVSLK